MQITLGTEASKTVANNVATLNNTLSADLTGDGIDDLPGFYLLNTGSDLNAHRISVTTASALITVPFARALGQAVGNVPFYTAILKSQFNTQGTGVGARHDQTGLVEVTFRDKRINGGATTNAFLEVYVRNDSETSGAIASVRLVFNDDSTVLPDSTVQPGGNNAEWVDPFPPIRAAVQNQIRKKTKALKRAKRAKKKAAIRRLKKTTRKLKVQLRQLC